MNRTGVVLGVGLAILAVGCGAQPDRGGGGGGGERPAELGEITVLGDSPFEPGIYVGEVTATETISVSTGFSDTQSSTWTSTVIIGGRRLPVGEDGQDLTLGQTASTEFGGVASMEITLTRAVVSPDGVVMDADLEYTLTDGQGHRVSMGGMGTWTYRPAESGSINYICSAILMGTADDTGIIITHKWEYMGVLER